MKKKEKNPEEKPEEPKQPFLALDPWQKEVLEHKGNLVVCSGRQTGKSSIIAIKAAEFVVSNRNKHVLIVSVTEDQAIELLQKVVLYIENKYKAYIKKPYTKNVLKNKLVLNNGSIVRTKAVGMSGTGARGFTIDMLIADEAAFMPEDVWPAVTPMLSTTGGDIILLSTPHGKKGYFWQSYSMSELGFKVWHINSVENAQTRPISETWPEWRKTAQINFIENEKLRMTEKEFGQEYLGQFVDDLSQWFDDEELKRTLIQEKQVIAKEGNFCLGVDIGRMGGDATVFVVFEKRNEYMMQRDKIVWKEAKLDQIAYKIIEMDKIWNFKKIYLDNGGIGIGVYDMLVGTPGFGKKRIIGVNNSEVVVQYDQEGKEKKRRWVKEEIYTNLKVLMQQGKIAIFDDGDTWLSLKSVQYEYVNQRGGAMIKIGNPEHSTSHIAEALVRASLFSKEKNLNPSIFSFRI